MQYYIYLSFFLTSYIYLSIYLSIYLKQRFIPSYDAISSIGCIDKVTPVILLSSFVTFVVEIFCWVRKYSEARDGLMNKSPNSASLCQTMFSPQCRSMSYRLPLETRRRNSGRFTSINKINAFFNTLAFLRRLRIQTYKKDVRLC